MATEFNPNNDWRRVAAVVYKKPRDSKIFGSVEFDITEVEEYIATKRREGLKITLTHIFLLAFARGLREETPELNCYIRRGEVVQRESIDVTIAVLGADNQMHSLKVPAADQFSLAELSVWLQAEVRNIRKQGVDKVANRAKNIVSRIPWPLRQWVFNIIRAITIDWGLPVPGLGVSPDSFGSFVLSNIGSIGLDVGYPALAPFSNVSMVINQGKPMAKPAVYEGEIAIRRLITFSAALDHRVVDAAQAGRLFNYVRHLLQHPEVLEEKPA